MDIKHALENIYISPLEACNLACKYCYTTKTKNILTNKQILNFIKRYQGFLVKYRNYRFSPTSSAVTPWPEKRSDNEKSDLKLKSIIFCGGEVFLLKNFTRLVNNLLRKNIFISIITNGTIDKLDKIHDPRNCQLLVSLDGPEKTHDQNRGRGNFQKTIDFIQHALFLDFPLEIFFLITKDSYPFKDSLPKSLAKLYNLKNLSYAYLTDHRLSLTPQQTLDIKTNYPTFPRRNFGCFQLSLQSTSQIYGCCESPTPLAFLHDPINKIVKNFLNSLSSCQKCKLLWQSDVSFRAQPSEGFTPKERDHKKKPSRGKICNGCCSPEFLCGYKKELNQKTCKDVVKLFNA